MARLAKGVAFVLGTRAPALRNRSDRGHGSAWLRALRPQRRVTHLDLTAGAIVTVAGAMVNPYVTYTYVPDPLVSPTGWRRRTIMCVGRDDAGAGGKISQKKPKGAEPKTSSD